MKTQGSFRKKVLILLLSSIVFLAPVIFVYFYYVRMSVEDYFQFSVKDSGNSFLIEPNKTKKIMQVLHRSYAGRHRYYYRNKVTLLAISKSGKVIDQFEYWPSDSVIVKQEKVESGNVFFRGKLRSRARYLDKQDNKILMGLLGVTVEGKFIPVEIK